MILHPIESHDSEAGFHYFRKLNFSYEIFWVGGYNAGWYWQSCLPGCLPDSDPVGPFRTSRQANFDAKKVD